MKCSKCGLFHVQAIACDQAQLAAGRAHVLTFDGLAASDPEDDGQMIVSGVAIPYGVELERFDWLTGAKRWTFDAGSVDVLAGAQLFYGHDHMNLGTPIGLITESEDLPAGHKLADGTVLPEGGKRITGRISKTPKGTEIHTLVQDKVLTRFSVGLDREQAETVLEDVESDAPLLRWKKAPVWETSVVPRAAYHDHAVIDALHRQPKGTNMKCNKCGAVHAAGVVECQADVLAAYQATQNLGTSGEDVAQLSAGLERVERQLATLGAGIAGGNAAPVAIPGRSYGDFLQMAARGDADALSFLEYVAAPEHAGEFLAFTGTETGELVVAEWLDGTWVGRLMQRMVERRRVMNLFTQRPLPATGMTVEYGRLLTDGTLDVDEQLNEGDLLAYGKLAFSAGESAPVRTFGGWSDMSRQVIERSGVNIVEALFTGLFNRYLQVTEGAVHTIAMDPANSSISQTAAAHDLTTADGWIDFVLDAAFKLDDAGLPLDFILVGRSRFKTLAKMRDGANGDAPRMLERNMGQISVTGRSGEVLDLPILPVNNPTDQNAVRAGSGDGIVTYEAPGAPFRLQDDDITNLTSAFSLYGYCAFAVENENALIRPTLVGDVV
jgi:hypothetical protein